MPEHVPPNERDSQHVATGRRGNRLVAAGVAVLGASVVAVPPGASNLADLQQRGVALTGSGAEWSDVFNTAADNLNDLSDAYTPAPVLTQIAENWSGHYADEVDSMLQDSADGLQKVIYGDPDDPVRLPGIENMLDSVSNNLENGDVFDAFQDWNIFSLEAMSFVLKPLAPLLGIPDEMLQNAASLSHELFSGVVEDGNSVIYDTLKEALKALSSPFISAFYAAGASIDDDADDVFDVPARMMDALLNGWTYPGEDEPFPGLLTEDGTLDFAFVSFPQQVAEILDLNDDAGDGGGGGDIDADALGDALNDVEVGSDGDVSASDLEDAFADLDFAGSGMDEDDLIDAFSGADADFTNSGAVEDQLFDGSEVTDLLSDASIDFDGGDIDPSDIVIALFG